MVDMTQKQSAAKQLLPDERRFEPGKAKDPRASYISLLPNQPAKPAGDLLSAEGCSNLVCGLGLDDVLTVCNRL